MKSALKNMQRDSKPNVVIDSGIAVSAFLTGDLAADLIRECRDKANLFTAEQILQEIRRVLLRKEHIRRRYDYSDDEVDVFLTELKESSTVVESLPDVKAVERNPKDDMIVACAVACQAKCLHCES